MSRLQRARALLASAGLLPGTIHIGHSPEINRMLDEFPCETCGRPVGEEARCSSQCLSCLVADIEFEKRADRTRGRELGMVMPAIAYGGSAYG